MRMGVHRHTLADAMRGADLIWLYEPGDLDWSLEELARQLEVPTRLGRSVEAMVGEIVAEARSGDHILVMSNGGFGGIHAKLLDALAAGETSGTACQ